MRLFGKRDDPARAIADFWRWWPRIRPHVEESIATGAVGPDAELVAVESSAGVRTLHLYADPASPAIATVRRMTPAWREGRASVEITHDPALKGVSRLS